MRIAAAVLAAFLFAAVAEAHPGASIVVSKEGIVYFVDTGGGIFSVDQSGHVTRLDGPAFHWFAFDPTGRYAKTPWPYMPGAEFRSAGTKPTLILSSDFPVVVASDGKFYYPDGSGGGRVRMTAIAPDGSRSIRATLPPIVRGGETIQWLNGLAAAPDGSLYYSDDRAIHKIDLRGNISTFVANVSVPNCASVPGLDGYTLPYLRGLAIAGDGSIYVAASGCAALLRVDPKGRVGTVLRSTPPWSPTAVATNGDDVYVLEYFHTAGDNRREWIPRVRKIAKSGAVTTLAQPRSR